MNIKDVEKLAELAKIELTDKEKGNLLKDMEEILGYVKQVQEVKVEETELEYKNKNVWREDEVKPSIFSRPARNASSIADAGGDLIINQFPDSQDGFVKVKKIL